MTSSVLDTSALLNQVCSNLERLSEQLTCMPTGKLSTWVDTNRTLIARILRANMLDPWFVLPCLHGLSSLTTCNDYDGDPLGWFADQAGLLHRETHQLKHAAAWLYQPSRFPLDPETTSHLNTPKRTALAAREQAALRARLASAKISLRGIQIVHGEIDFLDPHIKHLAPHIITAALDQLGQRPSVPALQRLLNAMVKDHNRRRKDRTPSIEHNQVRFSKVDMHGMMVITARCNANLGEAIRKAIKRHLYANKEQIIPTRNPAAMEFQALYQLLTNQTTPTSSTTGFTPGAGNGVGVVMTLAEYRDIVANPDRSFRTTSGGNTTWRDLQTGKTNVLDWIAYIGQNGLEIKHGPVNARTANGEQRLVASIRAPYCAYPDCDQRASNCEAHHVTPFINGGKTSSDNLALLCRRHHAQNDDSRTSPGRFHVELDENMIPYVIFHPSAPGAPPSPPTYNSRNLRESAVVKTLSDKRYRSVAVQRV